MSGVLPPHTNMQSPDEHIVPAIHTLLQAPQLLGSLLIFTHVPLQTLLPFAQQTPSVQLSPAPQALPHAPQLALSVFTSVQLLPHLFGVLPPHTNMHSPITQL